MIKLVVSDMDGTLINHQNEISPKNLKAIHHLQEKGIEFAIASGRDLQGIKSILDQYDIYCDAILGNGAQYVDRNEKVIMSCYLNKEIYKDIVKIFIEAHIPYMVFTTKGFYTSYDPEFVREAFVTRAMRRFKSRREDYDKNGKFFQTPCNHLQKIDDVDLFLKEDLEIIKVEAFSLNASEIAPTLIPLSKIPTISYLSSFDDNVEVTHQDAQKGLILKKVAAFKGLNETEIMVLGDGMNDLSLFEHFPYSFAPQNAEEKIKQLAYKVVADCQDDGFYEAISIMLGDL